jgi:hypothetical protein
MDSTGKISRRMIMRHWLLFGPQACRKLWAAMFATGLALAITLAQTGYSRAQDATSLERFLIKYRCPVVDRLERIYARGDPIAHRDEYLILYVPRHQEHYVQCLFYAPGKIYCEAASGFFFDSPGHPRTMRLPPDAIAALGRLGFSTDDSKGNFKIYLDIASSPEFNAIADLMLKALYDGFGARAETKLGFKAPYARHGTSKCSLVS